MKIKPILLLPGAIALCLSLVPVVNVSAQTQPSPTVQTPKRESKLNLSADQKTQIEKIRQDTKADIEAYLKSQGIALPAGKKDREAMKSLNLSDAQKTRIKEIRQASKEKISKILTPEQRAQMQQRHASWKANHQKNPSGQPQNQSPQSGQ